MMCILPCYSIPACSSVLMSSVCVPVVEEEEAAANGPTDFSTTSVMSADTEDGDDDEAQSDADAADIEDDDEDEDAAAERSNLVAHGPQPDAVGPGTGISGMVSSLKTAVVGS